MDVALTGEDIEMLLESLKFSKIPSELKRENLERIDAATAKLRALRDPKSPDKDFSPTLDEIKTAWGYYKQADNLQHQRHNLFVLSQTILFTALVVAQVPPQTKVALALIGAFYAAAWFLLAERLSNGMHKLSKKYLEKDKVYKDYLDSLAGSLSGRTILNIFVPLVTFSVWLVILLVNASRP